MDALYQTLNPKSQTSIFQKTTFIFLNKPLLSLIWAATMRNGCSNKHYKYCGAHWEGGSHDFLWRNLHLSWNMLLLFDL
jgi:frataxin-like iron-binding protein CyaY